MLDCVFARWQPTIGDPTWQGWATVLVYLATAALAFRAGRASFPPATQARERAFWGLTLLLLLALAVNKQLDLQSAVTAAGRCLALAQGWYGQRRLLQLGFLIVLALLAAVFLAVLLRMLRGSWPRSALPALGIVFVCTFVLMRAVGFHHIDRLLGLTMGLPVLSLRANTALEWSGPALISLGAVRIFRLSGR